MTGTSGTGIRFRRQRGEQGVVVLLVAVAMTMLLSVAAIVVDLGRAYVTARQMQNASDAAAMAGARTLDAMHLAGAGGLATGGAVDATVRRIATRNGAQSIFVTCMLIRSDGTPLLPCTDPIAAAAADGVQVTAGAVNVSTFAKMLGVDQLLLDRRAAATIQPLVGQDAPLLVCAFGQAGSPPPPDLLLPVGLPGPPTHRLNPAAVSPDKGLTGPVYKAHAPHVADCGLHGSSWKGVAGEGPFLLPDWLPIATGVKAGPTRAQIAGQPGCGADYQLGCVLVLPICSGSNGESGSAGQLYCELFGAFKLVAKTSNTHSFRLLGAAEAIVGIGGNGSPGQNDVRLVRLIR